MDAKKQAIMAALDAHARQRAGLEFGNYGELKAYRAEQRSITRDLHDYRQLARAVEWRESITADMLLAAAERAFSGRLTLTDISARYDDGSTLYRYGVDYSVGQYFPTEYRKAACAVLAATLWAWTREHAMPAPCQHRVLPYHGNTDEKAGPWQALHAACAEREQRGADSHYIEDRYRLASKRRGSAADWLRAHFVRMFGRGIASRWFS